MPAYAYLEMDHRHYKQLIVNLKAEMVRLKEKERKYLKKFNLLTKQMEEAIHNA